MLYYISEFIGSLVFLLGGYAYTCNISLKNTLIGRLNYIELSIAWGLSVGFGMTVAMTLGGPAFFNPGAVLGNVLTGSITFIEALLFLFLEFLAVGAAEILCLVFFHDAFNASKTEPKRGIFSAYPVEKNIPLNFVQEMMATFFFFFVLLTSLKNASGENAALVSGIVGCLTVMFLSLSLNSTGFSMNAMRSVFSSIWFAILPMPNKNGEKVDWQYQLIVNLLGSSLGGMLAVLAVDAMF